jgi:antitoxin YefM
MVSVHQKARRDMDSVSVNKFRDNLKSLVDQVISRHAPLRVTRRGGEGFVVISTEDWEREQETLYVLQNSALMKQIAASGITHTRGTGHQPGKEALDELTGI